MRFSPLKGLVAVVAFVAIGFAISAEDKTASFLESLPEKALKERAYFSQSNEYFISKLDEPQVVKDGQKLHPKLQYEFQERKKSRAKKGPDFNYNEWLAKIYAKPEGRAWLLDAAEKNWVKMAADVGPMAKVEDIDIETPTGTIRIRVYWPEDPATQKGLKPGLLYFHGGGFLMSSSESVEPQAKILAREGDMIVASVNYSLAPDHKFPASQLDALAAYKWFIENAESLGVDQARVGLGGDSAGGNLSVVISNEQALKGGHMPKAQLLYYPFTDGDHAKYRSYDLFGDGYGLDKDFMQMATELLLVKPSDANHRWLNLNDTVQFKSQPATIVATAGFDPIRDQGRVFAEKLKVAGVDVTHHHYASLNHGFLESSYVIDDAEKACFETARMMGALLRK